jgi:protein SCO1/2
MNLINYYRNMASIRNSINLKNSHMMLLTLLVVLTVVVGSWLVRNSNEHDLQDDIPSDLKSALLPEPLPLTTFRLTDQHGQAFGLDRLKGKWTFIFFGYTRCPDVCPTTLAVMKNIATILERDPRNIESQFVFVSMDPERDKPESLGAYVEYFKPGFIGITGNQAQLKVLGRQLNIEARRIKEGAPEGYLMSHTSSIMLIDPSARWYADFPPPHERASIIERFYLGRHLYQQEKP